MTVDELEQIFRIDIDDTVEGNTGFLVSPETFLTYLNEAQEEACIRSRLIFDNFSSFCEISILEDVKKYEVDERVYVVANAFINEGTESLQLEIKTRLEMDKLSSCWRSEKDKPKYLIQYDKHLELNPIPDKAYTINLECYLSPELLTSGGDEPEIHRINHRRLLHWVAYRYYDSQDNDVVDVQKARHELSLFEKIFGTRPSANNMRSIYSDRPQFNKVYIA